MSDDTQAYLAVVRDLLLAAFTTDSLRSLALFTSKPTLKPLVHEFSPGDGLSSIVDKTIIFCSKQDCLADLLTEVKKANPRQYGRFERQLDLLASLAVEPGDSASVEFPAAPRQRRWIGGEKTHPFTAQVATATGQPQTHSGEVVSRGRIPAWAPPLVIALCLILVYLLWLRPEPSVTVPYVGGVSVDQARATIASSGLVIAPTPNEEYHDTIAKGLVIGTEPESGAAAKSGDKVTLVVSKGHAPVTVPGVAAGSTVTQAEEALEQAGLRASGIREKEHHGSVIAGLVIRTEPMGGSTVEHDSEVILVVSLGHRPVMVPDVVKKTEADARKALKGEGLEDNPEPELKYHDTIDEGDVIETRPAAGVEVEYGSEVTLVVSSGREPVRVPDVAGKAVGDATKALEQAGLRASADHEEEHHDSYAAGLVIRTEPIADMPVEPDSTVVLVISKGLDPESDTDSDGMANGWEEKYDLDPRRDDAAEDPDDDGLSNLQEHQKETDPRSNDSDGDGFKDGEDTEPGYALGGGSGKIAFTSKRDDNVDIYLMKANGSDVVRLTDHEARDFAPTWSPDGKYIAFVSERDGPRGEIYVMDADGLNVRRLTNNSQLDTDPSWSPDGQMIAFESWRDGNAEIYVMNANGTGQRNVTNHPGWDWGAAWSPNGRRLVFVSNRDGNFEIYTMDAGGPNPTRATLHPAVEGVPAWSPSGGKIAFTSDRGGVKGLYLMNPDGSDAEWLTYSGIYAYPSWSPDGRLIAYVLPFGDNSEIALISANGAETLRLTYREGDDYWPAWQPAVIP